jgi:hypothetical protein
VGRGNDRKMVGDEQVARRMSRIFCLAATCPRSADHQAGGVSARAKLVSKPAAAYRLHGPSAGNTFIATCELITFMPVLGRLLFES